MFRINFFNRGPFLFLAVMSAVLLLGCGGSALAERPPIALPVFPGAQGFGTETPAGRGGAILKVTNLNDSGAGSLRAALEASHPRIIVFEVGGNIELSSDLKIRNPFVTVAGQTAPSPGITLKGAGLFIQTHDVLVQHLRIRVGDAAGGPNPSNREGLKISGKISETYNIVCDHLSVSWAVDEVVSTVYNVHDLTISNSIISEGLKGSIHPQGTHSKGMLIREGSRNLSLIGNLLANNHDRNPRIAGDSSVMLVNNLMYNGGRMHWIELDIGRGEKPHLLTAIGNVFVEGPNTPRYAWPIKVQAGCLPGTKVYHSDNLASGPIFTYATPFDPQVSSPAIWHSSVTPLPCGRVESWVLSHVGARPGDRDAVDQRVVKEMKTRTGAIINSVSSVGGWPDLSKTVRPFEIPPDPNGDDDKDGYTNIEEVLHRMAQMVEERPSL